MSAERAGALASAAEMLLLAGAGGGEDYGLMDGVGDVFSSLNRYLMNNDGIDQSKQMEGIAEKERERQKRFGEQEQVQEDCDEYSAFLKDELYAMLDESLEAEAEVACEVRGPEPETPLPSCLRTC